MSDFRATPVQSIPGRTVVKTVKRAAPLTGRDKRRGVRVNSQVPVTLEWDSEGESRRGNAQTRVVGPYGCLVVLSQNLNVDQQIHVTNLVSNESNPAVVVWRGNERAEGWELGIELINPQLDFWGLDL